MTIRIITGDCRDMLLTLPDDSVQCCVTSPPYWGLRSYLPADHADKHMEIGSEPSLQEWVETMVDVFAEVRRVLRPDGTLFLNLGDAYAGSRRGGHSGKGSSGLEGEQTDHSRIARAMTMSARRDREQVPRSDVGVFGLKPKDMMGQPWRVAFALQDAGWWLRQEIIWHKPNPMPESARDRCTKSHEHVFLMTKSERYFWNFDAIQETASEGTHERGMTGWARGDGPHDAVGHSEKRTNGVGFGHGFDKVKKPRATRSDDDRRPKAWDNDMGSIRTLVNGHARTQSTPKVRLAAEGARSNESFQAATSSKVLETRNPRSVWTIPTHGFKGAHFATFPPELARRCIAAGTKPGDVVLDPFGGAGTVGLVADQMQRDAVLIELDTRSVTMAADRIAGDSSLFADVQT